MSYSPDSKRIAAINRDNGYIFDGNTGRIIQPIDGSGFYATEYSPDGKWLACFRTDIWRALNLITIRDAVTDRINMEIPVTSYDGRGPVCWSHDGSMIAATMQRRNSFDRLIKIWNAATGKEIWTFTGHTEPIMGIGFSPDGKRLVSADRNGTIRIWDVESGWEIKTIQHGGDGFVVSFSYSKNGRYFLTARSNEIKIWGVE
jgi:WD40 repeat protein